MLATPRMTTPRSIAPGRDIDCGCARTAGATNGATPNCWRAPLRRRRGRAEARPSTRRSPPLECRRAALRERQHAFLGVLRLCDERLRHRLLIECGLDVGVERAVE